MSNYVQGGAALPCRFALCLRDNSLQGQVPSQDPRLGFPASPFHIRTVPQSKPEGPCLLLKAATWRGRSCAVCLGAAPCCRGCWCRRDGWGVRLAVFLPEFRAPGIIAVLSYASWSICEACRSWSRTCLSSLRVGQIKQAAKPKGAGALNS